MLTNKILSFFKVEIRLIKDMQTSFHFFYQPLFDFFGFQVCQWAPITDDKRQADGSDFVGVVSGKEFLHTLSRIESILFLIPIVFDEDLIVEFLHG